MNKEIKSKWTAALRSGEYEQGIGSLCLAGVNGSKKYCCLGVLCDLAVKDGVIPEPEHTEPNPGIGTYYHKYGEEGATALLPFEVTSWAGLNDGSPEVLADNEFGHESLTMLNDLD